MRFRGWFIGTKGTCPLFTGPGSVINVTQKTWNEQKNYMQWNAKWRKIQHAKNHRLCFFLLSAGVLKLNYTTTWSVPSTRTRTTVLSFANYKLLRTALLLIFSLYFMLNRTTTHVLLKLLGLIIADDLIITLNSRHWHRNCTEIHKSLDFFTEMFYLWICTTHMRGAIYLRRPLANPQISPTYLSKST